MRIFFIGTVDFSYSCLQFLLEKKFEVVGVATRQASKFNSDFADVTPLCSEYNIPVHYTNDVNSHETVSFIRSLQPDVIYCFGWSNLIKEEVLTLPRLGVVGYHPAALPQNRGRHPLIWALVLGLTETASTFFFMDEGADTGDILSQEAIAISAEDDAASLYSKMTAVALQQIGQFTVALANDSYQRVQQDITIGNNWRKRGKQDGRIDFRMHTNTIKNLVRALTHPYAGAHVTIGENDYKVWKAEPGDFRQKNIEPGKVLSVVERKVQVKTADASIFLIEHELDPLPQEGDYL